jgi:hypothetical protein
VRIIFAALLSLTMVQAQAALLDPASAENPVLDRLQAALDARGVDLARNLNSRECRPKRKPARPRLGVLADLPAGRLSNALQLANWEAAATAGEIGWLALLYTADHVDSDASFEGQWFDTPPSERLFITHATADVETATGIAEALAAAGYRVALASQLAQAPGRYYATAGQRLVLDTASARRSDAELEEITLLGREVRKDSTSVFPEDGRRSRYYAKNEPTRFRKDDLGDESNMATIPEIIVSGGIAFGEAAAFDRPIAALEFLPDHRFAIQLDGGDRLTFPLTDPLMLKACFDFADRSRTIQSDAIVDIDEKDRIKISAAFRNTDIGYELIGIDEQPFNHVSKLKAIKSVIIDVAVNVDTSSELPAILTEYEVRFINPDRRKLAETRAALVYNYSSATDQSIYRDTWGPRAFRLVNMEPGPLGHDTRKAALVAGWTALFRAVEQGDVDFSRGRYEFLRIDKAGKPTPRLSSSVWIDG